jgi:hypothetical protein
MVGGMDDGSSDDDNMGGILVCSCLSVGLSAAAAIRDISDVKIHALEGSAGEICLAYITVRTAVKKNMRRLQR